MKPSGRRLSCFLTLAVLSFQLASAFVLVGCTVEESSSPTPNSERVWQAWQSSLHADTYALEKGPNTYCARCHSPFNWDPAATIDPPPNCVSCKFPGEASPRLAKGNPLISESQWQDIRCTNCHPSGEDGVDGATIAWFDATTDAYESVGSSTALCEKCHRDTDTLRHERSLSGSAHADFDCTDCHDPHSTAASCTAPDCHPTAFTPENPVIGHDESHQSIACVACHDAAGLPVEPQTEDSVWMTLRTTEVLGRFTTAPYQSHALQKSVDCDRCHYPDNPWQLTVPVETIPESDAP